MGVNGRCIARCFINAELPFPHQVITRTPSASSVVRPDTCPSLALTTPKDSMLKVPTKENAHCVRVSVDSSLTENVADCILRWLLPSLRFS